MLTMSHFFAPLQGFLGWFAPPAAPSAPVAPLPRAVRTAAPRVVRAAARPAGPALRVLRVFESNRAPCTAGRMVISGRMADVCAELDRIAASEARLH